MIKMRRRLLNTLCLLSLVLAVAVAALWVRSVWWASDVLAYIPAGPTDIGCTLRSEGSALTLAYGNMPDFHPGGYSRWVVTPRGGFHWGSMWSNDSHGLSVPHWLVLAAASVLPAGWALARMLNRQRDSAGLCPRCGYDLCGSPGGASGGECPECGEAHGRTP